ncbi:NAD kinase [Phreatobacter sp.]|uniref:NAD kinase n=1 Tax=Phreatobacter sp. TaxID=1966341 RepID=UPI003F6FF67E
MPDFRPDPKSISFVASPAPDAQEALARLVARYGNVPADEAEVIIALGGDGVMLQTLHRFIDSGKPIYGMNRGSVGFLMNEYAEDGLVERIWTAERSVIHPLAMTAIDVHGERRDAVAINEVSLLRQTSQVAKLRILVDGNERMGELVSDGVLVATPAGSTAYNLSVNGPILPLNTPLLALTPISPFRPRRWRGALLPDHVRIRIEVLEAAKRPVSATADHLEVREVATVDIATDRNRSMILLHDPGHSLDERILREQFGP